MFNSRSAKLSHIVVFLIILSVFISPRINIDNYSFRLEDFVLPLVVLALLFLFMYRVQIPKNITYLWIIYLVYSSIISIYTYYIYSDIRIILYLGKEAQYFIVFLFFYVWLLSGKDQVGKLLYAEKIIKALLCASLIFGWYQILSRNYLGYYGIASIGEQASAASGATYFACLVFASYFLLKKYCLSHLILFAASFTCVLASISRSFIGASIVFVIAIALYEYYPVLKKKTNIKKAMNFVIFLLIMIVLFGILYDTYTQIISRVASRFETMKVINDFIVVRVTNWKNHYQLIADSYAFIIGAGKSFPEIVANQNKLYIDNQYLRNLIEIGLIGLIIWFAKLWVLYKGFSKFSRAAYPKRIFYGLLAGYLYAGVFLEIFQTARSGFFFWLISGFLLAGCYILDGSGKWHKTSSEVLYEPQNEDMHNYNSA